MILGLLACTAAPPAAPHPEPLRQEAYVWQRVWSPAVQQAVADSDFDALTVLAAEVSWSDGASVTAIPLPTLPKGTTLAIRAMVPPGDPTSTLTPLIAELLIAHPEAVGIQLDIDLPTARLGEYTGWLTHLSADCPLPIEITALPTWLSSPAMPALALAAARIVLQVHWLDPSDPDHLLDPDAAGHLRAMDRLGRPFSAALPTYGYQLALDDAGGLAGIVAEQGSLAGGGREVMADPVAVAALVSALQANRPEHLTGLHWFRLPIDGDQRAWPIETLRAVRQGRPPMTDATLTTQDTDGALTLTLRNTGEAELRPPEVIVEGGVRAADGLGGWRWSPGLSRLLPEHAESLMPGDAVVVGWLRPLDAAPTLRLSHPPADR
ncbi:MAG: hypothetical protein ACI8RZ_001128 [Myxococcota bacterium]|jgi:hypothetical protein